MICKKCNIEKPEESFSFKNKMANKRYTSCKPCVNKERNDRRRGTDRKAERIKFQYKINFDEYKNLVKDGCSVCGSHENLSVDHDHRCCPSYRNTCGNCIRGVLCRKCNIAEGILGSDPSRIRALADYVSRF